MDFQTIVDSMSAMACVVSVEKLPDDRYGQMRIVTGNKAYIDSIEHPAPGTEMLTDKFVPNAEYTTYLTRDLNFEEYCYRSAVHKEALHSYAHPDRMDVWLDMSFIPLWADDGDLCYCLYTMKIDFKPDAKAMSDFSEDMAASVLQTCIKLRGTTDFNATMKDIIKDVRELCDAEHCCILLMNEYERYCTVLGEAFAEGSKLLPMNTYLDGAFYDIAESWSSTIAGSNCLIVKNEQDMEIIKERNPVWYESLTSAGAHNIVLFPLKSRNQLLGYMWSLNFNAERAVKIKETLELTTFILGSELGNNLLLDRLTLLSSKDLLTGVMNRNEMNNYVDKLCHGAAGISSPVGVVFADLNGLKAINDLEGHSAGDTLLKNAANALREVFDEESIFRAGGDEFSVIYTGVSQEELDQKIENLREVSEKYDNLVFAIGACVENDSRNVRLALRTADERMYEDKRKFYEQFSEEGVDKQDKHDLDNSANEKWRERSLYREMNYDHLTKLPSMTYFFKLADEGRKKMHEDDIPSVLMFANFNGMRYYNTRYGFTEGDNLIRYFAGLISDAFGEDCTSRFGQDQFAAFAKEEGLEDKLNRIFSEFKRANKGRSLPVRIGIYRDSMGIVEASLACDRAKFACNFKRDDNRSYYSFYDEKMLNEENNRRYIIDNLDKAIAENWIRPYYQPIVRASNGRVCDEEALARWIDPERGFMSPGDFIPILEDTRLIYKVDLHIVDVILERLKKQKEMGLYIVPVSVNLSRTDFEACDIVEEICNRVDVSGVGRDNITIEITESVVGENFEFMKEQIERFQSLGFQVWMDDFGSGYSSLDLLQDLKFDVIKLDMRFMRQFDNGDKSKIILTELVRMAISLGIETVCEGVETEEQVEFLREIGCTKIQGFYYCKPIPFEQIIERNEKGIQIGFENPEETGYYSSVGRVNLYDLSTVSGDEAEGLTDYFNTLPMAVMESDDNEVSIVRCNQSYRDFMKRLFPEVKVGKDETNDDMARNAGTAFAKAMRQCEKVGQKVFLDERTPDGATVHAFITMIAENPVNKKRAHAVAVLAIIPSNASETTFAHIAQALAADYIDLYYVNLNTERFVQYSANASDSDLTAERHGDNFFENARNDASRYLYEEDRDTFVEAFTKENIIKQMNENGAFTITYRLKKGDDPIYLNMKVMRMSANDNYIIVGVSNVDAQMKQQETIERIKEERITFERITALVGDYICVYTVDPDTDAYIEYSVKPEYAELGLASEGEHFFDIALRESKKLLYSEDMEWFPNVFNKENVMRQIKSKGIYSVTYRLMIGAKPTKMNLRAGLVQEKDGPRLIVGIVNLESTNKSISLN